MLIGLKPTEKGEPATGVRVGGEAFALMANTEMFKEPELPTQRKLPAECMARMVGAVPTTVRGVCSLRAPLAAMVNSETSLSPAFAANKNLFEGWITIDCTAAPAVIGLPASWVSMPELGSSRYTTISLFAGMVAYKKRLLA